MLRRFTAMSQQQAAATAAITRTFAVNPGDVRCRFVPFRITPLGAHVDHQGGRVLGRMIGAGTVLAYVPLDEPKIRMASENFSGVVEFPLGAAVQPDHWARHARAAALVLGQSYPLTRGFVGVSCGALVSAGLASSASVGLAYLYALADVNGISLTGEDLVELDFQLECIHLGLQNGIQDQTSILFGQKHGMLIVDSRQRQSWHIPDADAAATSGWLIVYSGFSRDLISGGYNSRVAECRAAARWLQPAADSLSEVSPLEFSNRAEGMPPTLRRRATHYFGEQARVAEGVRAWRGGDLARFGELMNASCDSSIHNYESGHEAVVALQEIVRAAPGVYGSRFSGGGYGGCVVGLVGEGQAATAASHITRAYQKTFPALTAEAAVFWEEM